MKTHFIIVTLVVLAATSIGWSYPFSGKSLSNVIIVGNSHTNAEVIKRELLVKPGQIVSDSLLLKSRNRLDNLWIFNRVEFFPMDNGDSVSLLISVTERLYFYPYPEYKVEDRDWDKLTYGIGLAHDNFRGWNERLYISVQFGYRPGYKLSYYNPWIGKNWHLTSGLYLQKYTVPNRIEEFDENHFYTSVSVGKFWTRYLSSRILFSRDDIQVNRTNAGYMENSKRRNTNVGLQVFSSYDTRDLYAYPRKGTFIQLGIQKNGFFADYLDYFKYSLDMRKYLNWNNLILAGRIYTQQSDGKLPIYDRIFLGFRERIRGHFNEILSGSHLFTSGIAIRFPILPLHYYSIPSIWLPEGSTKNLKFGINGGIFAESGIIWNNKSEFNTNNFISGFGAGVHFLLPYIEVLRFDIAFDEQLNHEYIIEIEMPF